MEYFSVGFFLSRDIFNGFIFVTHIFIEIFFDKVNILLEYLFFFMAIFQ